MKKQAFFFIDDVICCFRDVAREMPKSLFDNPFFGMLKKAHDEYGITVQLNLFFRTDFFYGGEEFTLSDMPDDYKGEFEAASDWLKLQFHAKQEFPDYPYVNAEYNDVKHDCNQVLNEIKRFAGEKSLSVAVCPHWLPISKDGCRALYDCGIRFVTPAVGEKWEYNGDPNVLPYGHAARLLQNRKPETMLYTRKSKNVAIESSICAYNHITDEQNDSIVFTNASILDEETGLRFNRQSTGLCLNLNTLDEVEHYFDGILDKAYHGVATHEQYFYPDYYAYQPDYAEKLYAFAKTLHKNGYEFITSNEMK